LYLRKDQWIRLQNIGYENDIEDVQAACQALWQTIIFTPEPPLDESVKAELDLKPLTQTARPAAAAPAIVARPDFIDLTADSDDEENEEPKVEAATADGEDDGPEPDLDRLAYGRDDLLQADPSVVMGLLSLEELVTLGKKMKVNPGRGSVSEVHQT
jgi:Fanconi-associated nuclease 1